MQIAIIFLFIIKYYNTYYNNFFQIFGHLIAISDLSNNLIINKKKYIEPIQPINPIIK